MCSQFERWGKAHYDNKDFGFGCRVEQEEQFQRSNSPSDCEVIGGLPEHIWRRLAVNLLIPPQ